MTLKEELRQYYQEQEADFDPEETQNVLKILEGLKDDLSDMQKWDKVELLRLITDDELHEKVNAIEIPEGDTEFF